MSQESLKTKSLFPLRDIPADSEEAFPIDEGCLYRETIPREGLHFTLFIRIDRFMYEFEIRQRKHQGEDIFEVGFLTDEYGEAFTDLSDSGRTLLFETLSKLLRTLNKEQHLVKKLLIHPSDTPYSVEEIDACKEFLISKDVITAEWAADKDAETILKKYRSAEGKIFPFKKTPAEAQRDRFLFFTFLTKKLPGWKLNKQGLDAEGPYLLVDIAA